MVFSTEANGFSLNQLYRRSTEIDHDLPSLILIKDVDQNVRKNNKILFIDFLFSTIKIFLFRYLALSCHIN